MGGLNARVDADVDVDPMVDERLVIDRGGDIAEAVGCHEGGEPVWTVESAD